MGYSGTWLWLMWTSAVITAGLCQGLTCIEEDPCDPPVPCDYGHVLPSPSNCRAYQLCVAPSEWMTLEECKSYEVFDQDTCSCANKTCTSTTCPPVSYVAPDPEPCFASNPGTSCIDEEIVPDRYTCSWYHQCVDDTWICQKCPPENPFYSPFGGSCGANHVTCTDIDFGQCNNYTYFRSCVRFFTSDPPTTLGETTVGRTTEPVMVTTEQVMVTTEAVFVRTSDFPEATGVSGASGQPGTDNVEPGELFSGGITTLYPDTTDSDEGGSEDGLSKKHKIIIGCVCGAVGLILIILMIVFTYKHCIDDEHLSTSSVHSLQGKSFRDSVEYPEYGASQLNATFTAGVAATWTDDDEFHQQHHHEGYTKRYPFMAQGLFRPTDFTELPTEAYGTRRKNSLIDNKPYLDSMAQGPRPGKEGFIDIHE